MSARIGSTVGKGGWVLGLAIVSIFACESFADPGKLSSKHEAILRQTVVPAVKSGDQATVLRTLAAMTRKMKPAALDAADRFLSSQQVDSVGALLTEARIAMLAEGRLGQGIPLPDFREMTLVLPALARRIEGTIGQKQAHPSFRQPRAAPAGFMEYRATLESLYRLERQLEQADRWARHAVELGRHSARFTKLKLSDEQRTLFQRDYAKLRASVVDHLNSLKKTQLQLRLERLQDAESVLRLSQDTAERFMAVCALVQDARYLEQQLAGKPPKKAGRTRNSKKTKKTAKKNKPTVKKKSGRPVAKPSNKSPSAPAVLPPELAVQVEATAERARELAGKPLLQKASWFIEGLEWWSRGRYGSGPLAGGLLKVKQAKSQPKFRIPLYLPSAAVLPTDPEASSSTRHPYYDRRHHYTWNWENRHIYVTQGGQSTKGARSTTSTSTVSQTRRFWCGTPYTVNITRVTTDYYDVDSYTVNYQGRVTEKDPYDTYRLVGFFEYGKALEAFDKLLRAVDAGELAAIDKILQNSKEFTVYTNLSRRLEKGRSALSEPVRAGDRKKLGFAWVVALARVEFAAMLAGFTDTQRPFQTVTPTRYEMPAYKKLLLDGLRTHVWALLNDAELQTVIRNKSRSDRLLSYFRRAVLARKFGQGARSLMATELKPEQRRELETWIDQVSSLENTLRRKIGDRLDAVTGSVTGGGATKTGSNSRTRVRLGR